MAEMRDDFEDMRREPLSNPPFYGPSAFVGLIVDRGSFVGEKDRYIVVTRVDVDGEESEGDAASLDAGPEGDVAVAWLGPNAPKVGEYALVRWVPDRWASSRSSETYSICMNWTDACAEHWGGDALNPYDTTWLKNGVVTDANGSHPITIQTLFAPAQTPWIDFETDDFADADCATKHGTGRYRYNIQMNPGMGVSVEWNARNCSGAMKYARASEYEVDGSPGVGSFDCATASGAYTFGPSGTGMASPTPSMVMTWDRDEEARARCKCRQCLVASGVTPGGYLDMPVFVNTDQRLIYDFTDDDGHKSGELNMTVGNDLPGNDYIRWYVYEGERHLMGCIGPFLGHDLRYRSGQTGDVAFDVLGPWDGTKYPVLGTLRVKDYDDMSPDRLCCGVCDLPPVDFEYNFQSFGFDAHTDKFLLKYSPTKYVISGTDPFFGTVYAVTTNWRSEPVATPWHPFNSSQVAYFGCNFGWLGYSDFGNWGLYMLEPTPEFPYGYPGNPDNSGGFPGVDDLHGFTGEYEVTCRPWHYKLTVRNYLGVVQYIASLDEVEPDGP